MAGDIWYCGWVQPGLFRLQAKHAQNSSISQDAMKRARALLKTMLDHIHTLETTLSSRPLEQCSRPLTDFCIAIVQLWSETIVCFGRHAFSET